MAQSEAKLGLDFKPSKFNFLLISSKGIYDFYHSEDYEGSFVVFPKESGFKKLEKGDYYLVLNADWNLNS